MAPTRGTRRRARHCRSVLDRLEAIAALCVRAYTGADLALHSWDELVPTLVANAVLDYDYRNWGSNHVWLHKPPLALWMQAASMRMFGVGEWPMRLPRRKPRLCAARGTQCSPSKTVAPNRSPRRRNNRLERGILVYDFPTHNRGLARLTCRGVTYVVDVHRSRRHRRFPRDLPVRHARVQFDGYGRIARRLTRQAPLVRPKHPGGTERIDYVDHVRPYIRQRLLDRRHPG